VGSLPLGQKVSWAFLLMIAQFAGVCFDFDLFLFALGFWLPCPSEICFRNGSGIFFPYLVNVVISDMYSFDESDFCAPVVVVIATEEAERISLQNGLLLHELFRLVFFSLTLFSVLICCSCFGQLDGVNSIIRVGQQVLSVPDGHIRFERITETKFKSSEIVEEVSIFDCSRVLSFDSLHLSQALSTTFKPYDLNRLSSNVAELKNEPPTSWTRDTEQIFARSMSFTECDMISHPVVHLTIVATSDANPVAAMQELSSMHHAPQSTTNGQYDMNIHKVYILLEDVSEKKKDPLSILRGLNAYFPPALTKLLSINSFATPNVHQPDMWSRFIVPKYYPSHAPSTQGMNLPLHPTTGQPVFGCRLSVEDFMKIRDICFWLYSDQVIPTLEKRLNHLTRQVNDSRKGVKNVLKSFWRKPREDSEIPKGGVKYRYDKIESQTLLLGDLSFMLKDYETALSMYRLVRDDFKADKSLLHFSHSLLMSAICQIITEPNKYREVYGILDSISQCMTAGLDVPHAHAYFALLSSEIYSFQSQARSPLDAARILLQASATLYRYPLMSSLLIERAASFYMQSNHVRKYVLHNVIAGIKMHKISSRLPILQHSTVAHATCILLLEKSNWGDLKSKLSKTLSDDFKSQGREGAQRSLLFLLKILASLMQEGSGEVGVMTSLLEAVTILNEILADGPWGTIRVTEGWMNYTYRDVMLNRLPIAPLTLSKDSDISKSKVEVVGLPIPEINISSINMVELVNGYYLIDSHSYNQEDKITRLLLINSLTVEKEWIHYQKNNVNSLTPTASSKYADYSLEECIMRVERDFLISYENNQKASNASEMNEIPIVSQNEKIFIKFHLTNKLPIDVIMNKIHLEVNSMEDFLIQDISFTLTADNSQDIILQIVPKTKGEFHITNIKWSLSEYFTVVQPLKKKGKLLQKTLKQRASYERSKDTLFKFQVVDPSPLLSLKFEGLSSEILQGQLLKSYLVIRNDGSATAKNIYIKLSEPSFVFYYSSGEVNNEVTGSFLDFYGYSSTIVYLKGIEIQPNAEIRLEAWLRLTKVGEQKVSLLVSYDNDLDSHQSDGGRTPVPPSTKYSYISIKSKGLPSLGVTTQVVARTSTLDHSFLLTETTNCIDDENEGKEIIRLSSVGQLDLPDFEEYFFDIDRNHLKMVGLLMVGNASPASTVVKNNDDTTSTTPTPSAKEKKKKPKVFMTAPTERLTHQWSIRNYNEKLGKDYLRLQSQRPHRHAHHEKISIDDGWLMNSLPDIELDKSLNLTNNHLKSIVEQFLIIWYTHNEFIRKLHEAKQLLLLEEMEANASGPRSIQQVRRERQKISSEVNADGMETVYSTSSSRKDFFKEDSENSHAENHHVVYNMSNIVKKESLNNSIGITFIWVCRWQEKIRWGMHHIPFVSILSYNLLSKEIQNNLIVPFIPAFPTPDEDENNSDNSPLGLAVQNSLSFLQLSVQHEKKIIWETEVTVEEKSDLSEISLGDDSNRLMEVIEKYRKVVSVKLRIKSHHPNRAITFSVQGLSHQFSHVSQISNQNNELILTKLSNMGFTWVRKSRYNELVIQPKEEIVLDFYLEVLRPGVYNLHR
jgi:hypothetical protein